MNVTIRDAATLRDVPLVRLVAYLRTHGWDSAPLGPSGTAWSVGLDDERLEILLPNTTDVRDYALRIAEALAALALHEGRSQGDILADVLASGSDIIRFAAKGEVFEDGTAPISVGVRLLEQAEEALLSAACAALIPKGLYPTRKPPAAIEYMKKVRLGQTERGSFVVSIQSPVSPALTQGTLFEEPDEPYERRVVITFAKALEATKAAIVAAAATGSPEPFLAAVPQGVNANLCESLARILENAEIRTVEVRFSWSATRTHVPDAPAYAVFQADEAPLLAEASRVFREREPQADYAVIGPVVGLQRAEGADNGVATIAAVVDGPVRKVLVELPAGDYEKAIAAHESRSVVRIEGELVKFGRQYSLNNPHDLIVTSIE